MNLLEKAKQISTYYRENNKLAVLFIGGSVSRGWQDQYSDIELFLLWDEPPSDEDRLTPIKSANGTILDFHPYEDNEWSETFLFDETKFEISSFLTSTVEEYIKVVHNGNPSLEKQCLLGAIVDGIPLKGESRLHGLKTALQQYPDQLKANMIQEHLQFGGPWQNREALLYRGDHLMLYRTMTEASMNLMAVLSAINNEYIHHPRFKWVNETSENFRIKPVNFHQRLLKIFGHLQPEEGVRALESLINETIHLIENEFPSLDIDDLKMNARSVRPRAK
ncbi:DUF4037 domain-containing protein [Alkalihalobacillus sp. AL-G]|uniref:nucleotidyltransferase domain-containing protein n=1 Tax=Alkalihalobacillus sp. AL-G TaxID=2926399 RepID=UPI00272C885D|nr:nucleotidyltransferase domain-containing protein [Alkalihalobacillus sp. AL-G]WLD93247.1 DUF4037 domain-containing protein [Alkalihalobacillus sp. AL-G]